MGGINYQKNNRNFSSFRIFFTRLNREVSIEQKILTVFFY
jgi:hypothetical protein